MRMVRTLDCFVSSFLAMTMRVFLAGNGESFVALGCRCSLLPYEPLQHSVPPPLAGEAQETSLRAKRGNLNGMRNGLLRHFIPRNDVLIVRTLGCFVSSFLAMTMGFVASFLADDDKCPYSSVIPK